MNYSEITNSIESLTLASNQMLNQDLENFKLLEVDIDEFMLKFFRPNILNSYFIFQVCNLGQQAIYDYQTHTHKYIEKYIKKLTGISDISYNYNPYEINSIVEISLGDMPICYIDFYDKKIFKLDKYYYMEIDNEIDELLKEKEIIEKKYDKISTYSNNPLLLLSEDKTKLEKLNIIISSTNPMKKNKYKSLYNNESQEMLEALVSINDSIDSCLLSKSILEKQIINIKYIQSRVIDRITNKLKFTIIDN